ncbi:hypothetical protein BHE74_00037202 [Ensete ventricosum]|nr:hypothetical protein BHE74_00037202 [Ensete ventricosum]
MSVPVGGQCGQSYVCRHSLEGRNSNFDRGSRSHNLLARTTRENIGRTLLRHRVLLLAPNVVVFPQRSLLLLQCLVASGMTFSGLSGPLTTPHIVNHVASHPSLAAPSVDRRVEFSGCPYRGQVRI